MSPFTGYKYFMREASISRCLSLLQRQGCLIAGQRAQFVNRRLHANDYFDGKNPTKAFI